MNKNKILWWAGGTKQISSGALAIWSFRLLRPAYSGKAIRIQRQSDNAQTDISFSAGKVSKTEVDAFVVSTTARIVTVYDQSGNGLDLTATNATAPQLYYDSFIANYSANFGAIANSFFTMPAGVAVSTQNFSLYSVLQGRKNGDIQALYDFTTNLMLHYQSAFDTDSVYDGVAHSSATKYLPYSVDYNVVSQRGNGTNVRRNYDNLQTATIYSSPLASSTTAGGSIGKWSGAGTFGITGLWFSGVIYSSALADEADTTTITALQQATGKTVSKNKCVIGVGDSITFGFGASTPDKCWFTKLYQSENNQALNFFNSGVPGNKVTDIQAVLASRTYNILTYSGGPTYINSVCIAWAGTNDILAGVSGATTYTNYKAMCQSIKAGGVSKIIAVNILPRTDFTGAMNTERSAFNSALASDHTFADAYVDVAAIGGITYSDVVHPDDAGNALIAPTMKTALDSII